MKAFLTAKLTEEGLKELRQQMEVKLGGWGYTGAMLTPGELAREMGEAEVLIVTYEAVPEMVISENKKLKCICVCRGGAGEKVDVEAATRRGIPVLYTPGRNAAAVADLTIGLILAVSRNIALTNHLIKSRDWARASWDSMGKTPKKTFQGPELDGKVLGIVGFGHVGREVAVRAKAFGMQVMATDPYFGSQTILDAGVGPAEFKYLLEKSDFVSIHCPYTSETHAMFDAEAFKMMKPSAYIINTARGAIIDENALLHALKEEQIAGAALDVLCEEPMRRDHPFLDMDNVVLTPHIGGASDDIFARQTRMIISDLIAFLKGHQPRHVLNPQVLVKAEIRPIRSDE